MQQGGRTFPCCPVSRVPLQGNNCSLQATFAVDMASGVSQVPLMRPSRNKRESPNPAADSRHISAIKQHATPLNHLRLVAACSYQRIIYNHEQQIRTTVLSIPNESFLQNVLEYLVPHVGDRPAIRDFRHITPRQKRSCRISVTFSYIRLSNT